MSEVQLIKLREGRADSSGKKKVRHEDTGLTATSVLSLLQNWEEVASKIPLPERYSIYYTAAECEGGVRKFKLQRIIPFDIDHIDYNRISEYHPIFASVVGVEQEKLGIVASGYGLQYIVHLDTPFTSADFFDSQRAHYKAICTKIGRALKAANLPGDVDPTVFSDSRILRMPGTINRNPKKNRPDKTAYCISVGSPTSFILSKMSGIPEVDDSDQVHEEELANISLDTEYILSTCEFLKRCKQLPNSVTEPEWYAMLSILGRLKEGRALAHEYSSGYRGYTHSETESKLDQAMDASGPRTCKNVATLSQQASDDCAKCPAKGTVKCPLLLRSPNFIGTKDTGFYTRIVGPTGIPKLIPNYEDLRRFFEQKYTYKNIGGSRICLVFDGMKYQELSDAHIENFAQEHFNPKPKNDQVFEFRKLISRTNLQNPEWFSETTIRKVNFMNGVLDIVTGEFGPHSDGAGFRYVLDYDFDKNATCPTFDTFLHGISMGDKDWERTLLEVIGYAVSNDEYWIHKCLLLDGFGRNGKSTLIDLLKAMVGKDNYSIVNMAQLNNPNAVAMMDGKLFNLSEETPERGLAESSMFKTVTSGGEVTARKLYKDTYMFRNRAKFIFSCNELPDTKDISDGLFERLIILPFRAKFTDELGNRDPDMLKKLLAERAGIFNKCIAAWRELKKRGRFTMSGGVKEANDAYKEGQDIDSRFFEDALIFKDDAFISFSEIYIKYETWAKGQGELPIKGTVFARRLARFLVDKNAKRTERKINGKSQKGYKGLALSGVDF